ncbi:unnamed protein product [Adineta steineri]|uniref:Uncharacterized protein n=1 Tax=Adineta steineri TaxID=433720 RepID=A0A814K9R3_9BILA|nr:unnamed protein product [Adineta steineri]CAF3555616.1 unnamed protein product [Adineta steineri]CAF3587779.1 unnamed protein product [Adineta steineri]
MSSANDTYLNLLVQMQPKSILKKSPSPRFPDTSINLDDDHDSTIISSSSYENEKNYIDIDETSNNHICILNDNQSDERNISTQSFIETPFTKLITSSQENFCQNGIDNHSIRTFPRADSTSSSSSVLASGDEQKQQQQQQPKRIKMKPKKTYSRPFITTNIVSSSASSSDNNDERKAKRSLQGSKITIIRSDKHRHKDMQLDEFMRKYQQQGGIYIPPKENHDEEQITTDNQINDDDDQQSSIIQQQQNSYTKKESFNDDTISLLKSIDAITLSPASLSPLQLLFDVARTNQFNRRTKIDHIRQYVEEQIGISAFLTIYKLIKSSQIPIDIRQKPFCHYANFIPHLCCLIMLESEQQKKSIVK